MPVWLKYAMLMPCYVQLRGAPQLIAGGSPSIARAAGIHITNDGHAILREIDVSHPAAKVNQCAGRAWSLGPVFSSYIQLYIQLVHSVVLFKLKRFNVRSMHANLVHANGERNSAGLDNHDA